MALPNNGFKNGNFSGKNPTVYISAETDDVSEFDQRTIKNWEEEGFEVVYLPFNAEKEKAYKHTLKELGRGLGLGAGFAFVAFGDAANVALEIYQKPHPKLLSLVAYYPSNIPDVRNSFPISLRMVVHLCGEDVGVTRNAEVLGIQGKPKTRHKHLGTGLGAGGLNPGLAYPCYTYEGVEPGFAEHDLDEYDKSAERLAWSRSLREVRKGFGVDVDAEVERIWDEKTDAAFNEKHLDKTLKWYGERAHITHVPTMTGARGRQDLRKFYAGFFQNPEDLTLKLISRTVGVDRVVDELVVKFRHTCVVPWILPGVPPTGKVVEIPVVSIVAVKAGKLESEHLYWDQASVLVQIGMLDPEIVPKPWKDKGVVELPICGEEATRLAVDEYAEDHNELIDEWWEDEK